MFVHPYVTFTEHSTCTIYLVHFDIKNTTTEIIEVYGMVRKKQLDAGNSIHCDMEVSVIGCGDEDKLR